MKNKLNFLFNKIESLLRYPLHYCIGYLWAYLFGSLKSKIQFDIFRLPHYAFGVYEAAMRAKQLDIKHITVIEFGVANGRGLIAMAKYAEIVERHLGITISVIGFDSGEGMPGHEDYKDHPELYLQGDFPMQQPGKLQSILPGNTKLIICNLNSDDWTSYISTDAPAGFLSIDVDYYSSTKNLLEHILKTGSQKLMPNVLFYFDDITLDNHNKYQGELLAVEEFNAKSPLRKFDPYYYRLKTKQVFNNAQWLWQIYQLQVLDHPQRNEGYRKETEEKKILGNKYLNS